MYKRQVRINPHITAGGNAKIAVGSRESKFGISVEQVGELEDLAARKSMGINGVHMHTGSDIYDVDVFLQGAELLFAVAGKFPVEYVDFGSGFKVPYKPEEKGTDVELLGEKLSARFNRFVEKTERRVRMIFEPGKFLVSRAGTLLVRVDWVKKTPAATFAQVDSGLVHLVRPMMYDAYPVSYTHLDAKPDDLRIGHTGRLRAGTLGRGIRRTGDPSHRAFGPGNRSPPV